jgi:protein-S-isoprenylcysteine O-methyltransferase Ste14
MYLGTYLTISLLILDPVLWVFFVALIYIYYVAAQREEEKFLATGFREEYVMYRQQAGMFFPKIIRFGKSQVSDKKGA